MAFTTKPTLAKELITRALDGSAAAGWVAGDEVYGADPGLRTELERRQVGYVLAVACSHPVTTAAGTRRADDIAARLPKQAWQRLSAGAGSKSPWFPGWAAGAAPPAQGPAQGRAGITDAEPCDEDADDPFRLSPDCVGSRRAGYALAVAKDRG